MRHLTSFDAQFLALEDGRNHGHVSALGIYDPSTAPGGRLTLEALRELLAQRIHLLEPFRWRLAPVPFGLDHPYWVEDPSFDLEFHLRELALPVPGDDRQLAEQAARLHSRPLDRAHPLWEVYLIQGLQGGRVAVMTKMHHAAIDGVSGGEVLGVLLDPSPEGREVPPAPAAPPPRPVPGDLELLGRTVLEMPLLPLRAARALPRTLPHLDQVAAVRVLPGVRRLAAVSARVLSPRADGGVLERPALRAPRTRFNGRISAHRRFAFTSLPLADVKAIKDHLGLTVNDVVMGLCAGALRRRLQAAGELPAAPLLTMVSVIIDGVGLNFTVLSYRGNLDLGVIGDRELAPDVWELIDDVYAELAELRRLLPEPARRPATMKEAPR
jgi:WS/DGAT/MGAT family acyltransferase